jgi:hypothetical protein
LRRQVAARRPTEALTPPCSSPRGHLQNVAHDEAAQAAIIAAGGVPALVEAMRRHSNKPTVVEPAAGALTYIAGGSEEAGAAVEAAGATAVIIAIMEGA